VSRPAGAASRLVGLHTPPSTYSRPPIVTGANSHGTVHDASDRLGDGRRRCAGAAEYHPAAGAAIHRSHPQAPIEPGIGPFDLGPELAERVRGAGETAQQQRAHQRPAGGGDAERQRGERGAGGQRGLPGAPGGRDRRDRQPSRRPRVRPPRARCRPTTGRRGALPATR